MLGLFAGLFAGLFGWIGRMLVDTQMQHALLAGTAIALVSGAMGYFVVLRNQLSTIKLSSEYERLDPNGGSMNA